MEEFAKRLQAILGGQLLPPTAPKQGGQEGNASKVTWRVPKTGANDPSCDGMA